MKDKVQKIREEVERLQSQLLRGTCSSQVTMETRCKEEAYNEVLAILDTMQEEPVSEELEEAVDSYTRKVLERTNCLIGNQPVGEEISKAVKFGAKWQETKDKQILNEEGVVILPEEEFERMKRSLIELAEKEQQMMAKAFPVEIDSSRSDGRCILSGNFARFETGDKVKLVIIKEG